MSDTPYPKINGSVYDFTAIEFRLAIQKVTGISSLDYKVSKKGKYIYGASVNPIARTRGTAAYEGSIEVLLETYYRIKANVVSISGRGFLDQEIEIIVSYGPNSSNANVDTLIGCRFEEIPKAPKQGDDAVMVKIPFSYMNQLENGVQVVPEIDAV